MQISVLKHTERITINTIQFLFLQTEYNIRHFCWLAGHLLKLLLHMHVSVLLRTCILLYYARQHTTISIYGMTAMAVFPALTSYWEVANGACEGEAVWLLTGRSLHQLSTLVTDTAQLDLAVQMSQFTNLVLEHLWSLVQQVPGIEDVGIHSPILITLPTQQWIKQPTMVEWNAAA